MAYNMTPTSIQSLRSFRGTALSIQKVTCKFKVLILAVVFVIHGCSSPQKNNQRWVKNGVSSQQYVKDISACDKFVRKMFTSKSKPKSPRYGAKVWDATELNYTPHNRRVVKEYCMGNRGYKIQTGKHENNK